MRVKERYGISHDFFAAYNNLFHFQRMTGMGAAGTDNINRMFESFSTWMRELISGIPLRKVLFRSCQQLVTVVPGLDFEITGQIETS